MADTAQMQKEPLATADAEDFSRQKHFFPVDLISDDDSDEASSADLHRGWDGSVLRRFLGVDDRYQAVFHPSPRSFAEVRRDPSSTGKLVEWEGVVETVSTDSFEARLTVLKGSEVDFEEFTTFEVTRVPSDDRELILPGALFRLVVGFQALGGTRQQYSRLTFRRLPAWNRNAIEVTQSKFEKIVKNLEWSDEVPAAG